MNKTKIKLTQRKTRKGCKGGKRISIMKISLPASAAKAINPRQSQETVVVIFLQHLFVITGCSPGQQDALSVNTASCS